MDEETKIQDYLRDLAERLLHVPVMYGTDQSDTDRLHDAANKLDELERQSGKVAGGV